MKKILCISVLFFMNILFCQTQDSIVSEMDTLTLKKTTPVFIKKDTIIYNVENFTSKHDENLEVVLSKMKGIKILPNGEIEVNGKIIRKILINNTELSDVGAAAITRTISPADIENISVRLNEKNKKIKESIIEKGEVAVLDIKIKKNVKQKLFGKQKIDVGFQDKFKIGGSTNIFSINPKINTHLFIESNNFGKNTIELHNIKNIGEDSYSRIFSTPTDIDDIKSRSHFHEEIYGFDNFKSNDKSIFGISINIPINKSTDLYLGSFNNYNFISKGSKQESFFYNQPIYNFYNYNRLIEYNTKNKIQLKYISNKIKIKTDFNYVYSNQDIQSEYIHNNKEFFDKIYKNRSLYLNGEFEYGITPNFGVFYNTNISFEAFNIKTDLFPIINNIPSYNKQSLFYQSNDNKQVISNNEFGLLYKTSKTGTHTLGYRYHNNNLENNKLSNFYAFNNNEIINSSNKTIFYKNNFNKDKLNMSIGIDYSIIKFPNIKENTFIKKEYFQYDGIITYSITNFSSIKISSQNKINLFPIQKVLNGYILKDFQTILVTRNNLITPFYNRIYSVSYDKDWGNKKSIAAIYTMGISDNLNDQYYLNNYIYINANQLTSKYHIFSSSFNGKINKNFSYGIEPEFIINSSEQTYNNLITKSSAYRFLLGTKINYVFFSKKIQLNYHPKYSYFLFKDSNNSDMFDFLSNNMNISILFMDKKLKTDIGYRQVNFIKNKSHFIDVNLNLSYKTNKYKVEFSISNLFNQNNFIIHDQDNAILNITNNFVFRRFINLGFEFKI